MGKIKKTSTTPPPLSGDGKKRRRSVTIRTEQDVRRLLQKLLSQQLNGELTPDQLRACVYACNSILSLFKGFGSSQDSEVMSPLAVYCQSEESPYKASAVEQWLKHYQESHPGYEPPMRKVKPFTDDALTSSRFEDPDIDPDEETKEETTHV